MWKPFFYRPRCHRRIPEVGPPARRAPDPGLKQFARHFSKGEERIFPEAAGASQRNPVVCFDVAASLRYTWYTDPNGQFQ